MDSTLISMKIERANRTVNNNPMKGANNKKVKLILDTGFTMDMSKYGDKTINTLVGEIGQCHAYDMSAKYWDEHKIMFVICFNDRHYNLKLVSELSDIELGIWTRYGVVVCEYDKITNKYEESKLGSMERVIPSNDDIEAMRNDCFNYLKQYMRWVWKNVYHVSYEIHGNGFPSHGAMTETFTVYGRNEAKSKVMELAGNLAYRYQNCTIRIERDDLRHPRVRKTKQ